LNFSEPPRHNAANASHKGRAVLWCPLCLGGSIISLCPWGKSFFFRPDCYRRGAENTVGKI